MLFSFSSGKWGTPPEWISTCAWECILAMSSAGWLVCRSGSMMCGHMMLPWPITWKPEGFLGKASLGFPLQAVGRVRWDTLGEGIDSCLLGADSFWCLRQHPVIPVQQPLTWIRLTQTSSLKSTTPWAMVKDSGYQIVNYLYLFASVWIVTRGKVFFNAVRCGISLLLVTSEANTSEMSKWCRLLPVRRACMVQTREFWWTGYNSKKHGSKHWERKSIL